MNRYPEDKPRLIINKEKWKEFIKEIDDIEYITYFMDEPPKEYPCFVYCITDYSDWNGHENDIYCFYFYMDDARDLIISSILDKAGIE